ncbi:MAG: PQQ-dependent sugar dehydrogenase [Solirubrobacterales bacterium]
MHGTRIIAAGLAVAAALAGGAAIGATDASATGLALEKVGTFDHPTYVTGAPGFRRQLYVVEQPGTISVVRRGRRLKRPFLDLTRQVGSDGAERGLLSVAFPLDYKRSRRFYVYYTNRHGDNEIDELKRSRRHPARAVPSSRRRVLLLRHPGEANHNGGQLQFGPGGDLYVGTGDGGGSGDSMDNARHLSSPLGKILRIDPRKRGRRSYTVPRGNPFVGVPGARPEIYSYGLRNPWRFSFDRQKGALAIGDVGQNREEEIDYTTVRGARGANFGWPEYEGDLVYDAARPDPNTNPPEPTVPIFTYTHFDGCAVIGGYVVRDPALRRLSGRYLYADLCTGEIRSLRPKPGGARKDRGTGLDVRLPTSFGEDDRGRIYVASRPGPVYRLKPAR